MACVDRIPGRWLQFSFFLIILLSSIGFGQNPVNTSKAISIEGWVRDAAGAAIAKVPVSLLNARQAVLQTVETDEQGQFVLTGVAAGSYELPGERRGVALR
jgi:hypothetical protein